MKKGKEPVSRKYEDIDSPSNQPSLLHITDTVKKVLDSKDLACKWISDITYRRNYGFNKEGWKPHKFSENVEGMDPEGFLRRGDLILASQPTENVAEKKARIRRKTQAYEGFNKEKANELRRLAKDSGLDMQIHEGYEDNE